MNTAWFLLAAPALSMPASPAPGEALVFGDWVVGCDNMGSCTAVALVSPQLQAPLLNVTVRSGPTPDDPPQVVLCVPDAVQGQLSIDGRLIEPPGEGLAERMRHGRRLQWTQTTTATARAASLDGFDAVAAHIAHQRSPDAGWRRPDAPPAFITRPPASDAAPAPFDHEDHYRRDGCGELPTRRAAPAHVRLDAATTLVLLADRCLDGAYNFSFRAVLVDNAGVVRLARFDHPGGMSGDADGNDLTNAGWDQQRRRLTSQPLARSTGDCGARYEYVWDGALFRLALLERMPTCRGATSFLPVWRAEVGEQQS